MSLIKKPIILIADDNSSFCDTIKEILSKVGIELRTVSSLSQLITSLRSSDKIRLLILDSNFERSTPSKIVELLKGSVGLDIPFVILSANTIEQDAIKAQRIGALDYLLKSDACISDQVVSLAKMIVMKHRWRDILAWVFLALPILLAIGFWSYALDLQSQVDKQTQRAKVFYSVLEQSSQAVILVSSENDIINLNENGLLITNYKAEEVIGKPISTMFTEEEISAFHLCSTDDPKEIEKTYITKGWIRTKDNNLVSVIVTSKSVPNSHGYYKLILINPTDSVEQKTVPLPHNQK